MTKTFKKAVSILLAVIMILSVFTIIPMSAGASTWTFELHSNFFTSDWNDVTLTSGQDLQMTLAAGNYEFLVKAYEDGNFKKWRGNEVAGSSTDTYSQTMYDDGGNAKFEATGGYYALNYDAGTGLLTITKKDYVAEVNDYMYETFADAATASHAANEAVIKLLANAGAYTMTAGEVIKVNKNSKTLTLNAPAGAYAVETTAYDTSTKVYTYTAVEAVAKAEKSGTTTYYASAYDALRNAATGSTITLLKDSTESAVTVGSKISGKTYTIDLNDKTLTLNGSGNALFNIASPSHLTIQNGTIIFDGSGSNQNGILLGDVYNSAELTLANDLVIDAKGTCSAVTVAGGTLTTQATMTSVNSPTLDTVNSAMYGGYAANVTGGSITCTNEPAIRQLGASGTMNITGGTISGVGDSGNEAITVSATAGATTISGGTFNSDVSEFTTTSTYQNANGEVVAKEAGKIYDAYDLAQAAAQGGDWYIVADVTSDDVTVTSNLKIWNTDKTHTITADFTVADGVQFAVAGKKTTNIDGDITLAGQDSKVVSTRANKVILTEPYKTGQVFGVPAATQVLYDGKEIVFDSGSLTNAASKGGVFYVVDSFTCNAAVSPSKDLTLIGLLEDGSNPTITVESTSATRKAFSLFNPANGKDLTIEGIDFAATKTDDKVIGVVNTNTASSAETYSTITITDSEISGFSVSDGYGAIYLHGYSQAALTDVVMSGNGEYDVWGGGASDVTISGGSYASVYLNGGTSEVTIADEAAITKITAAEGTTIAAADLTNVTIPDDCILKDNGDGSYTVTPDYVAEVNGQGYMTFAEAVDARNATSDVITLIKAAGTYTSDDHTEFPIKVAKSGKSVTIAINDAPYYVSNSTADGVTTFVATAGNVKYTNKSGVVTYMTGIPAALNEGTYQLLDDVSRTQRAAFGNWADNVTIDLNGHTFTSTASDCAILLGRNGNATTHKTFALVDTSTEKGGKLVFNTTPGTTTAAIWGAANTGDLNSGSKYNDIIIGEGVTVEGGSVSLLSENQTLIVNGTINGGDDFAVVTHGSATKDATITINDGAVLTSNDVAMYLPGDADVTINGGTITGATGIYQKSGTLTINGGTITGNGEKADFVHDGSGCNATGDAIVVESCGYPSGVPATSIGNATLVSANGVQIGDYTYGQADDADVTSTSNELSLPVGLKWVAGEEQGTYVVGVGDFALKHSISLEGDIALNFYLNPEIVKAGDTIDFAWTVNDHEKTASYTLSASDLTADGYKATVSLPAAEMNYQITASYGDSEDNTDTYSIRDYCDVILSDEYETAYTASHGAERYAKLETLVLNMLDYGAKAQTVFGRDAELANHDLEINNDPVTVDMVEAAIKAANNNQTANDMTAVAEELGVTFYTSSLVFLSKSTLKVIFTTQTYPSEWPYADEWSDEEDGIHGSQSGYYYWVQKTNIAASQLDTLQTFTIGDVTFKYSALDYVKELLNNNVATELAAATYWYNDAANKFFGTNA